MCKSIAISNLTPGEHQGTFWRRLSISGDLLFGALDPCHCSGSEVTQSSLTLCNPMDCSLPGSSVHGIFQATVLEWVAISFSWGSSRSRNQTRVSRIAGKRLTVWATREAIVLGGQHLNSCFQGSTRTWSGSGEPEVERVFPPPPPQPRPPAFLLYKHSSAWSFFPPSSTSFPLLLHTPHSRFCLLWKKKRLHAGEKLHSISDPW